MKTTFKGMALIAGLGGVILLLLHLTLQYGLTRTMRAGILPRIRQETGLDVRVAGLSLNVPNGRVYLKGVEVRNPAGFALENACSVDQIEVAVDAASLLRRKPLRITEVRIRDARVNIVRNGDGALNIERLPAAWPSSPSEKAPSVTDASASDGPRPLPEILVESLSGRVVVRYLDLRMDKPDLTLDLHLEGRGLTSQPDPGTDWGRLELTGSLAGDRTRFRTDLQLELAPVTHLAAVSFDLTGRIAEIDPRIMGELYDTLGIRSGPFGFDPDIHCRNGRFQDSFFVLNLHRIKIEDPQANRLGGLGSIEALRFPVPVEGTLQEPLVEVQRALNKALGGNAESVFGTFLEGEAEQEPGPEGPDEGLKKLGRRRFDK